MNADDGAVDVDANCAIGRGLAGCRVDAGEQVGAGGGEVEHLHLVDLALVQSLLDGLVGPQAELGVPQGAVGLRVTRVVEGREVAEHVEQVAAAAQRVDQRRVAGAGVLGGVAVVDQVHEPL